MHWYVDVLKKYAVFSGRARRKEYWMFVLFNVIVSIVLSIIDNVAGTSPVISSIYSIAVLLPALGVTIRRLHDTDRSGWWVLIALIPLVGSIILLVFLASEGKPGVNAHGPNPKQPAAAY
ncbi:DUF805 domain-containing protein [Streptomyces sp. LP05-1]|uniref:DUF805 domain-containing protein n=1 Tax=Streptomyces pyxinae TaxID=2970734 RepID=A0ABT2CLI2_9ACTN|nr:DUF805 domain-containing protein [Streptomyces sp. LP05-1]MCS0638277.1 DUF805 domain-containing protein [Streptomyces sp. LP05-1]